MGDVADGGPNIQGLRIEGCIALALFHHRTFLARAVSMGLIYPDINACYICGSRSYNGYVRGVLCPSCEQHGRLTDDVWAW